MLQNKNNPSAPTRQRAIDQQLAQPPAMRSVAFGKLWRTISSTEYQARRCGERRSFRSWPTSSGEGLRQAQRVHGSQATQAC